VLLKNDGGLLPLDRKPPDVDRRDRALRGQGPARLVQRHAALHRQPTGRDTGQGRGDGQRLLCGGQLLRRGRAGGRPGGCRHRRGRQSPHLRRGLGSLSACERRQGGPSTAGPSRSAGGACEGRPRGKPAHRGRAAYELPFATEWTEANAPAILHLAHNGQEEGNALADVLFGDVNPAGRLGDDLAAVLEQLPPMMDYDIRTGRTYMYSRVEPLYAFGHGLSLHGVPLRAPRDLRGERRGGRLCHRLAGRDQHGPARRRRGAADVRAPPAVSRGAPHPGAEGLRAHLALAWRDAARAACPGRPGPRHLRRDAWALRRGAGPAVIEVGSSSADIRLQQSLDVSP